MRGTRIGTAAVAAALLGGLGCVHTGHGGMPGGAAPIITVPPPGEVPGELHKVTLPPYVVEAPDNLLIQVYTTSDKVPLPAKDDKKEAKGDNGADAGKQEVRPLPVQSIDGSFQVRLDGSVGLGYWGSVTVAGLTLDQVAESIRQHLVRQEGLTRYGVRPDQLIVLVDVLAYNSKRYYVITDGGGYGEQVYPFPIYGSETVLDAIANINGLPAVASKRNIWVARRCPTPGHPWQILPVDWIGITQHGITATNYQIMPGDRVYVKAQKLVTIDTALARIISPVERVFGITLLGSATVNSIQGRGSGFGGQ